MADLGDKLTSEQRGELESKIADVRSALSTDDVARIKSAREALEQAFYKISEGLYRQQGTPTGAYSVAPKRVTLLVRKLPRTTPSKASIRRCRNSPYSLLTTGVVRSEYGE
jgi:hypothetical protein